MPFLGVLKSWLNPSRRVVLFLPHRQQIFRIFFKVVSPITGRILYAQVILIINLTVSFQWLDYSGCEIGPNAGSDTHQLHYFKRVPSHSTILTQQSPTTTHQFSSSLFLFILWQGSRQVRDPKHQFPCQPEFTKP